MLVIPAVDIKDGECVRLLRGDLKHKTVYSSEPLKMAKEWEVQGAKRLHLVDLDGAMRTGSNLDLILRIKNSVFCEVQMGGGLRSLDDVKRVLEKGIDRVVIGTAILKKPEWVQKAVDLFKDRIIAGVDSRHREVKLEGWKEGSGLLLPEVIRKIEAMGFQEIIFTDISRDGMMLGPNIPATRDVLKMTKMSVYASGGISGLDDIKSLKSLVPDGLKGCIVGKALYDGKMSFRGAVAAAR